MIFAYLSDVVVCQDFFFLFFFLAWLWCFSINTEREFRLKDYIRWKPEEWQRRVSNLGIVFLPLQKRLTLGEQCPERVNRTEVVSKKF